MEVVALRSPIREREGKWVVCDVRSWASGSFNISSGFLMGIWFGGQSVVLQGGREVENSSSVSCSGLAWRLILEEADVICDLISYFLSGWCLFRLGWVACRVSWALEVVSWVRSHKDSSQNPSPRFLDYVIDGHVDWRPPPNDNINLDNRATYKLCLASLNDCELKLDRGISCPMLGHVSSAASAALSSTANVIYLFYGRASFLLVLETFNVVVRHLQRILM
ncbi:hypothetical protein NPIL_47871 [Nephila pilipes]|uniref:Uncharacterized protein n=1 Tax=Nephila pilipes TaxID=299642 RepID=A0A8X6MNE1_NEPPI|nr:hypothetical protein NPIL_47871 [Nephila pilipes]